MELTRHHRNTSGTNELIWHATAAANILEARKRKGRVGGRKSRHGCLTCKQRRIKCDELQPSCRNCTDSGRQCAGYAPGSKQAAIRNVSNLIGVQLSQSLGLHDKDRRSFDFFLSWTSPRLGGAFDKDFWCGQLLQVAHAEPAILDSLLAISELYEHPHCLKGFSADAEQDEMALPVDSVGASALGTGRPEAYSRTTNGYETAAVLGEHHMSAVKHYNRAIRKLTDQVAGGKASLLVALLSCVLFICVEVLRDNVFAALNLYNTGYQILRQIDSSNVDVNNGLYISLKLMMTRLGILAAMYGQSDPLDGRCMSGEVDETSEFKTMSDARSALYVVIADSLAFHRAAIPWKRLVLQKTSLARSMADITPPSDDAGSELTRDDTTRFSTPSSNNGFSPFNADAAEVLDLGHSPHETPTVPLPSEDEIPEVLVQQWTHLQSRLSRWYDAMQRIPVRNEEAVSNLMMYYHSSLILMASRLSLYESAHDEYTHHYQEIISFAEIYYRCRPEQPSFTFEPGAIPILWMVVTKCRVPSLRRHALALIRKAPKKECMWGRDSVAEFGARVIAIEEEGSSSASSANAMQSPISDVLPSESSRIYDLEILKDARGGESGLRVTRYVDGPWALRRKCAQDYPV